MHIHPPCRIVLAYLMCFGAVSYASAGELWRIGTADHDTHDLALGPDGYSRYGDDPLFAIGVSDARQDWPYVHPGPADAWAGGRAHAFAIVFGLGEDPSGGATLVVDLVDTHHQAPPRLQIECNGQALGQVVLPGGAFDDSIFGDPGAGKPWRFAVDIPASALRRGNNTLRIINDAGSWLLYDSLALTSEGGLTLTNVEGDLVVHRLESPPALFDRDGELKQAVFIHATRVGAPGTARVSLGGAEPVDVDMGAGTIIMRAYIDPVSSERALRVTVTAEGAEGFSGEVTLRPVRKWTVCIMHHTHLDIGYTHTQEDVEQLQMRYLDEVLDFIDETTDYPEGARFTWMPEGLWPVESYLRAADTKQRQRFFAAVKAGRIGLDALYGNALTALYSDEELFALVEYASRLRSEEGVTIDSAMISDVPGLTWGTVSALAQSGVRYLSSGPNMGHRIGWTQAWNDRPVYWVSPSGQERILFWMAGKGYSWFHGGGLGEQRILQYLAELEDQGFPYDIVHLRYNIGGDNGYPDRSVSDLVREWNETYAYPKLLLTTTSEMFRLFEERYGDGLPVVAGDMTPYWEDGAGSTAADTAACRRAAELLVQAQALFAMRGVRDFPTERIYGAWRQAVLYDEHTWGAWNSISDPDSDFAVQQAATKGGFAQTAEQMAERLLAEAAAIPESPGVVTEVDVSNTSSWPRSQLVVLPAHWRLPGDRVMLGAKRARSQRLSTGELAFVAEDVPALSSVRHTIVPGEASRLGAARAEEGLLSNGALTLSLDPETGAIAELSAEGVGNIVDCQEEAGLNAYIYVASRDPKNREGVSGARITVQDAGPLVASLLIESEAAGAKGLTTRVMLVDGLDRVFIDNVVDKLPIREKEAVHFAFPFDIPDGMPRIDTPWAVVRPELDQLEGACRDYYTAQRWVDVNNNAVGVTLAAVDAPLVQIGEIRTDIAQPFGANDSWSRHIEPSPIVYSYAMNNYWETNYKADQSGPVRFRYALRPYPGVFNPLDAARFGMETTQPLVVAPAGRRKPGPLLRIEPEGVIATSVAPTDEGLRVRLYAASGKPESIRVLRGDGSPARIRLLHADGSSSRVDGELELPGYGLATVLVH